ncbi:FMN-binding glutamate synthase family protein [Xanthomonadaceae bacterium JHOS43]|nr:FMN-binding glutamate synthase family protein [Xanthomonadaceae bacterium JHOS43]
MLSRGGGAGWWVVFGASTALSVLGIFDLTQRRRALRRNYPVSAHVRFLIERFRPEIRQYLIEDDEDELPFSRVQRSIVYQRAKGELDKRPFGTQMALYQPGYEWINHSLAPVDIPTHDFRITIGGPQCTQPYSASVFNISAMSFGALSANAVMALNEGARRGGFFHDTGEGSISRWHRQNGGDLVWEIGSGYFGCRDAEGRFDLERFRANALDPQVKMIEIKLSQGAKPGQGGILPGAKVSPEIAEARGVPVGVDCISPARHTAFDTPAGLLQFVQTLRDASGGKPVGFKLAIGHPWEWFGIAKAIVTTGILPDFIVVDGGEGGTGAAPLEFTDHVGVPLREALMLVHNTLVGLDLRDRIRVGAAGKITTAFDLARVIALGADWGNAARGFMFALGCIQSQSCHTDKCPTGVATQDPRRQKALDVPDKATRVHRFHDSTLQALKDLLAAAGLEHPAQLGPEHLIRRVSANEVRSLAALHSWVKPGELLAGGAGHQVFQRFWALSTPDSFAVPPDLLAMRNRRAS